jgi:hypothetical protein
LAKLVFDARARDLALYSLSASGRDKYQ